MTSNLPNSLWWWEHVNLGQKSTDWCKKYQLLQKTQRVFFALQFWNNKWFLLFYIFFWDEHLFRQLFPILKLLLSVIFQMSCWKISNDWQRPMWRFFLSEIFCFSFRSFFYLIFFTFQDILNYLDSSNTSTETGKAPSVTDNNTSSNPLYSNPKLSHLYQNQSSHPESPSSHNSLQNHLQELMDTEAELEKLTRTMTAFQKPIPPPRQVSKIIFSSRILSATSKRILLVFYPSQIVLYLNDFIYRQLSMK